MKCPLCKKNISDTSLKCPYCKTRTGVLCVHCNTVNPVGKLKCSKCGNDLLKVCSKCNSVNFPTATKCRKCSTPFKSSDCDSTDNLKYNPQTYKIKFAIEFLSRCLQLKDKKIISISGEKGSGKTTVLKSVMYKMKDSQLQWCVGKCSPITQLMPGGVIVNMLLSLFSLPKYNINNNEFRKNIYEFFSQEFKFLKDNEINDFINFIYCFKDGNYEDIIINKKKTFLILSKIFDAFCATERFVFVIDNFDFIDGFSAEFFSNFIDREQNWKNLKFIAIYSENKPISAYFAQDNKDINSFEDIAIAPIESHEIEKEFKYNDNIKDYISENEKKVIAQKSKGNLAYLQQAYNYSMDCQINDLTFIIPENFCDLVKLRLDCLEKNNKSAMKLLIAASILGSEINMVFLKEIFSFSIEELDDIINYLVKANFIIKVNENDYEFSNFYLWETILKNISKNSDFYDINAKIGRALSIFNLNTNAMMSIVARNLRENRMSFDIWTKTARLCAYVGDINLYVIAQKQCLAILNEFNESDTIDIRYSISEKLGKLLSEYDPQEALDFLPDAISHAKSKYDEIKEIELLGYLASCCSKTGNYFGNVECVDNVLSKIDPSHELERAMCVSAKLQSLLDIGNCGEIINLIDNDILPILNKFLLKPRLNNMFPIGLLFDTWLKVHLILANALTVQGNNRCFEVLAKLYSIIDKHKITDKSLLSRVKLIQAYACVISGQFAHSQTLLNEISSNYLEDISDLTRSRRNLVSIANKFLTKEYEGIRNILFDSVTFANNTGDNFTKNIVKTLLGKLIKDENKATQAIEIYNEQVTYFAKEKIALGALLCWYLIADATIVTENSKSAIDIATKALEISLNPKISNYFFASLLNLVIAKAYLNISDFTSAKIHIEESLKISKKYEMNDLLSRGFLLYGKYYFEIGSLSSENKAEYLKGASLMYGRSSEIIENFTKNISIKSELIFNKDKLRDYCERNNIEI